MIIRSKAPLRLGLAGGGTDVSPFSDLYGGHILNVTINMYAYTTLIPTNDGKIVFENLNNGYIERYDSLEELPNGEEFILQKGVYNRIIKDYNHSPLSFKLSSFVDAPAGSGLGTSSTLVVSTLGAFVEWLKLPLSEYDIASLAYQIERIDLKMAGGKQDQYAATFGGVNFMEFYGDKVIVNPLKIKNKYLNELSHNIVLYYTETSRFSSKIIESQRRHVNENNKKSIEAMHNIKLQASKMKEALLIGNLDEIGPILDISWQYKKQMADEISNKMIDDIYDIAMQAGSTGGKVSGAGGGGFMFFYCPKESRYNVISALSKYRGHENKYDFTLEGLKTWTL